MDRQENQGQAVAIMVQGTASHVGKSAIATALCRIFSRDGYHVAPFKSWNMALNSYVTSDGGEIGRAQGEQAEAAGIDATVDMNPLLIKPSGPGRAQVIVRGRVDRDLSYEERSESEYIAFCLQVIAQSLARLKNDYEILVLEGAGSPAEINLQDADVANMKTAHLAEAPVVLVSDIDRGGALAAAVGTVLLLPEADRARVAGFVMNKFRGDVTILEPGLEIVRQFTGVPVIGVIPYVSEAGLAEEDGVALDADSTRRADTEGKLKIAVIRLPHISNFTDFDALQAEPDVALFYTRAVHELAGADAVIIPGTKNSMRDLLFLHNEGLAAAIIALAADSVSVVGICGGYQMLGKKLSDPQGSEMGGEAAELSGLGLLDTETLFYPEKKVVRVAAASCLPYASGRPVAGYEIHMGQTERANSCNPAFVTAAGPDGAFAEGGRIWGTYMHGVFDELGFRRSWLNMLRTRRGWQALGEGAVEERGQRFDALADAVENGLDMQAVYKLLNLPGPRRRRS